MDASHKPAVLLLHGFTGSPVSMQPWADDLSAHGYEVEVPTLPGHATTWQDLNGIRWQQWYACADDAVNRLSAGHKHVVVGGLSMGGAIALRLAELRGADIAGVITVNPFIQIDDRRLVMLPLLQRILPSLPGITDDIKKAGQTEGGYARLPLRGLAQAKQLIDATATDLARVTQPLLMFRSSTDHTIGTAGAQRVIDQVSSQDATDVVLTNSYHVATLDNEAETIHRMSRTFLERFGTSSGGDR